jgi:DNA-binding NarL/FixJ family response regulator
MSKDVITQHEIAQMLSDLGIEVIYYTDSLEETLSIAAEQQPTHTFIDLEFETSFSDSFISQMSQVSSTKITLIKKRGTNNSYELKLNINGNVIVLEKPVTITLLNDIVHPELSFGALLAEAESQLKEEGYWQTMTA